eukprot:scaffold105932_cov66-Phaeocystis_antarctica.AAC.2
MASTSLTAVCLPSYKHSGTKRHPEPFSPRARGAATRPESCSGLRSRGWCTPLVAFRHTRCT